jgi:hypothetical protein
MGLCLEGTIGALFSIICFANYLGKFNSFWIHFNQGNLWGFHFNEKVFQAWDCVIIQLLQTTRQENGFGLLEWSTNGL